MSKPIVPLSAVASYLPCNKLVAVVEISNALQAVPLCQALLAGGVQAIEITLRTPQSLQAIQYVAQSGLPIALGAGTILSVADLQAARQAGATFFVSPAAPIVLLEAVASCLGSKQSCFIPGIATASEAMTAAALGFTTLKLFPAEACGGVAWLKALAGPLPHLHFMPTGGVSLANLQDYARLPTVVGIGGTWLAPKKDIELGHWASITTHAKAACAAIAELTLV